MNEFTKERRQHRRCTFFSEVRGERLKPFHAGPLKITVSNICRNGLMLHTDCGFFLSPGYQVQLTFLDGVDVLATVVWIRHHGIINSVGHWAFGVAFDNGQDAKVNRICEMAEEQWSGSDD